jgi:hypothetical protein
MTEETFPRVRIVGAEHWTEDDIRREGEWRKAMFEAHDARRQALLDAGWTLQLERIGCSATREMATPAEGGDAMLVSIASERLPNIPPYPRRPELPALKLPLYELHSEPTKATAPKPKVDLLQKMEALAQSQVKEMSRDES